MVFFSRFLNCTNGTKWRKVSRINIVKNTKGYLTLRAWTRQFEWKCSQLKLLWWVVTTKSYPEKKRNAFSGFLSPSLKFLSQIINQVLDCDLLVFVSIRWAANKNLTWFKNNRVLKNTKLLKCSLVQTQFTKTSIDIKLSFLISDLTYSHIPKSTRYMMSTSDSFSLVFHAA